MTTKKFFSVPIKEGETDLVSKDDLKTMTENLSNSENSGSIVRYSDVSIELFVLTLNAGDYFWPSNGDVSWSANITEDYSQGLGCDPFVNISFPWTNIMLNMNGQSIVNQLSENRTKITSITGISSIVFYDCLGSKDEDNDEYIIKGTAKAFHISVMETIIDNESGEIIETHNVLSSNNASVSIEVHLWYSFSQKTLHVHHVTGNISLP